MTKQELTVLKNCSERIKELASLEHASFNIDKEKDKAVKDTIRPYMMWFELVAIYLDDLQELTQRKSDCVKRWDMEELVSKSCRL